MSVLTFGKHKGSDLKDIPSEYLEWGAGKLDSPKWRKEFEQELSRRRSEKRRNYEWIKQNINSPDVWVLLLKEAEKELNDEEEYALEIDCQYDGRIISQKEVEELAKEKLAKYQAEIDLEVLEKSFLDKWGLSKKDIAAIQDAWFCDSLQQVCSSDEKFVAANEFATKRNDLICSINDVDLW
ncbi:MAG: hypothetical protein ACKPJF_14830 [Dolichospermum sp.]